ncbi:natural killer cells antigen CD94-like [Talpa occidentalis]|uniref:natural killer cells antigen CD94-like n=1 Tax=Talpa occidentalis TaxID=50954 RepID=UPI0023F9FC48|nr:natural killer cells antigen CD94-like [Talpa occidentalis]
MATLGIVLKNSFHKLDIETTLSPGATLKSQEDSRYSSCQERWVGYQCNCYFISSELKTWKESRDFCASRNSTLLQMHNKDELHFMKLSKYFYWIGVTYSAEHSAWVWEDGSVVSQDLLPNSQTANPMTCVVYGRANGIWDEPCTSKNMYICQQQLI